MTQLRGGVRSRLITDSYRIMMIAALEDLHWFDPNRRHAPLNYVNKPEEWEEVIPLNTFSISPEQWQSSDGGLGNQPFDRIRFYVDLYAESEALGKHLAYDMRSIILGLMPDIGRTGPELHVFDTRQATPSIVTTLDVDDVRVERATGFPRDWQRHWFVISCFLEDDYLDDIETETLPEWDADLASALTRIRAVE